MGELTFSVLTLSEVWIFLYSATRTTHFEIFILQDFILRTLLLLYVVIRTVNQAAISLITELSLSLMMPFVLRSGCPLCRCVPEKHRADLAQRR